MEKRAASLKDKLPYIVATVVGPIGIAVSLVVITLDILKFIWGTSLIEIVFVGFLLNLFVPVFIWKLSDWLQRSVQQTIMDAHNDVLLNEEYLERLKFYKTEGISCWDYDSGLVCIASKRVDLVAGMDFDRELIRFTILPKAPHL